MNLREELEAAARRWISLWCAPVDWALFDQLHAADFVDGSPAGRGTDKRSFAAGLAELMVAFPDLQTHVDDLVVDESRGRIAIRWSAVGTNCSRFLGVGPTGLPTPLRGIEIIEVRHGKITKRWGEWDSSAHSDRER